MAADDARSILEVRNLNSFYGRRQVLEDISFRVPAGKVTVIMGVSGCGKSTLLRHLIGLKPTDPAQIFVDGKDLAAFDSREMEAYRKRIGVLFQAGALFNSMTVRDNIAVPLRVHTHLAEPTISIMVRIKLHQVGLTRFADYMPSQLSGGMRKRAGLARALAMDPEILFVDEPSSGLDPITAAGLDDLILELREAMGMTLIVVTHELESAFRIADQLIVLDQGRVLAAGPPESIRESRDERVVQFLSRRADERARDQDGYLAELLAAAGGRDRS